MVDKQQTECEQGSSEVTGENACSQESKSGHSCCDTVDNGTKSTMGQGDGTDSLKEDEKMKNELEETKKSLARVRADFHNYKMRVEREAEKRRLLAAESAALALIPVYDNLERTLNSIEKEDSPIYKGIEMVCKQFFDAMTTIGVVQIDTQGIFDPALHEALGVVEVEDEACDGSIVDVLQQGFSLGGKVLRASKVRVAQKI